MPKFYQCVLCKTYPKGNHRQTLSKKYSKILQQNFGVFASQGSTICNKCRFKCYIISKEERVNTAETLRPPNQSEQIPGSPPFVHLPLCSTISSHAYCCVCKRPGPKLIVVKTHARVSAYIGAQIFVPEGSRCCPNHIQNEVFNEEAISKMIPVKLQSTINKSGIMDMLSLMRDQLMTQRKTRLDFDSDSMTDLDYATLTGLSKYQFDELMTDIHDVRTSKSRTSRTCIAIFMTKMRSSLSNRMLSVLFNMTKYQIRRSVMSARKALMASFVPQNLGFQHIDRDAVINDHTRPLARELFANDGKSPAILVLDGTYIYIQKSGNFQRRSYSLHKNRPLVKPMMVVTTTGYIVAVLGPYLADSKNSDARILNHMLATNVHEIKEWVQEEDVFVVDRGFRDSAEFLEDLGITMEMPSFLKRGDKQLSTEESNNSRLVTKVRWVVESVNGRIKTWRYLDKVLPNSQIPYIGDYVQIICALCNKFRPPLSTGTTDEDINIASKMKYLSRQNNMLKMKVEQEGMEKRSFRWKKVDCADVAANFPHLSEEEIRNITIGVYQVKMAKSYVQEHLDEEGTYEILVSDQIENMVSAQIQSRHTSAKKYMCFIQYEDGAITGWYCKCKIGARVVGACGHITSVIWYMGNVRHQSERPSGVRNWTSYIEDAGNMPDVIDGSDSDDDVTTEE
ncbi:hypothetical protein FSP39_006112 [Pinctada imbricata]|uniref:DDE Tnp4 domain-containing protein n=1 Tax=Pinctada imbricata TaxID=66713 RepID=A0AA88YQ32_PINIB|nr:hypothetical protein FSP39_006112 [Pinctada imbricata]